jgi:hypothetical protein
LNIFTKNRNVAQCSKDQNNVYSEKPFLAISRLMQKKKNNIISAFPIAVLNQYLFGQEIYYAGT